MIGSNDLEGFDGDLTEDDAGEPLFIGVGAVVGVRDGEEGVTVDPGVAGGFDDWEELDESGVRVEDSIVEVVTVEVVVEPVLAMLAPEPAGRVARAEAGVGRPAVGPSFKDVERDGRRHFFSGVDSALQFVLKKRVVEGER